MEKLGIAMIGCGRVSESHLHAIRELSSDLDLIAVVDKDEQRALKIFNKYNAKKYYLDVKDAFNDQEIDAVVIGLAHHLHLPMTLEAAKAGKHILIEKPMALNYQEAKLMVEEAKKNNVILMVGQSRRYYEAISESRRLTSELGSPLNIIYVWGDCFNPEWSPPWWSSKEKAGGLVIPLCGSHAIDYVLWVLQAVPKTVFAATYSHPSTLWEGEDQLSTVLSFDDGSIATVCLSATSCPEVHQVALIGPKGSMKYTGGGPGHVGGLIGFYEVQLWLKGELIFKGLQSETHFKRQMREFHSSIKEKRAPMASGEEILNLMKVLDAVRESAESGKIIHLTD